MSIQVGTQIPQFELLLAGRPYRAEPGKRGQLLYFMRTADCPVGTRFNVQLVPDPPNTTLAPTCGRSKSKSVSPQSIFKNP